MKIHLTQTQPLRLFWGENYAPKPKAVQQAIAQSYNKAKELTHLYPGGVQDKVKQALAKKYSVAPTSIVLGNGIEGLLATVFSAHIKPGDEVITYNPTFSCYKPLTKVNGGTLVTVPVDLGQRLSPVDILSKVTRRTKIVCLASPNTTTGCYHLTQGALKIILISYKGLVVIDECYFGIGKKTMLPLIKKHDNLVILRSASKSWGLAGIRVGFGFACPKIIAKLDAHSTVLAPDPLPIASYLVLLEVLSYTEVLEDEYASFQKNFTRELKQIKDIVVYHSETTFIPVAIKDTPPLKQVIEGMRFEGFALKDTTDLGYLLLVVPPKTAWTHFFRCLKKSLKKEAECGDT